MAGRLEATAAGIAKGKTPEAAMIDAGFGRAFAAGFARVIVELLQKQGLIAAPRAKAAPPPAPAPEIEPAAAPAPRTTKRISVREEG